MTTRDELPVFAPDLKAYYADPQPFLKAARAHDVPSVAQIGTMHAYMITRYADVEAVFQNEDKLSAEHNVERLVSTIGPNLMRKDGEPHRKERMAVNRAFSGRAVAEPWRAHFKRITSEVLDEIAPLGRADMVKDIAMRICAEALIQTTGLTNVTWQEMDRLSQGIMDSVANAAGDPEVAKRGLEIDADIDRYIDEMVDKADPASLLSALERAGQTIDEIRGNIKVTIGGGQNEPRDALSGAVYAMLAHPDQLALVRDGTFSWSDVFDEYIRWVAPIGSQPRVVIEPFELNGVTFQPGDVVILSLASAIRDERVFRDPDNFDLTRETELKHKAFGFGRHFCGGAHVARGLVADVALPMIFERLKGLRLDGETVFGGFALRGPLVSPVCWDT
jgi:cytochrome P450